MDKRRKTLRLRCKPIQDLSHIFTTSDESSDDDEVVLPSQRKKIFQNSSRPLIRLRPSVVKRECTELASSTPMCSSRKPFNKSIPISPILNEEPIAARTRKNSNVSLQQQVISSTSESFAQRNSGSKQRQDHSKNNTVRSVSEVSNKKKKNNGVIFPSDNTVVDKSALARTLDATPEVDPLVRTSQDMVASCRTSSAPVHSKNLAQKTMDKGTQITDSLEKGGQSRDSLDHRNKTNVKSKKGSNDAHTSNRNSYIQDNDLSLTETNKQKSSNRDADEFLSNQNPRPNHTRRSGEMSFTTCAVDHIVEGTRVQPEDPVWLSKYVDDNVNVASVSDTSSIFGDLEREKRAIVVIEQLERYLSEYRSYAANKNNFVTNTHKANRSHKNLKNVSCNTEACYPNTSNYTHNDVTVVNNSHMANEILSNNVLEETRGEKDKSGEEIVNKSKNLSPTAKTKRRKNKDKEHNETVERVQEPTCALPNHDDLSLTPLSDEYVDNTLTENFKNKKNKPKSRRRTSKPNLELIVRRLSDNVKRKSNGGTNTSRKNLKNLSKNHDDIDNTIVGVESNISTNTHTYGTSNNNSYNGVLSQSPVVNVINDSLKKNSGSIRNKENEKYKETIAQTPLAEVINNTKRSSRNLRNEDNEKNKGAITQTPLADVINNAKRSSKNLRNEENEKNNEAIAQTLLADVINNTKRSSRILRNEENEKNNEAIAQTPLADVINNTKRSSRILRNKENEKNKEIIAQTSLADVINKRNSSSPKNKGNQKNKNTLKKNRKNRQNIDITVNKENNVIPKKRQRKEKQDHEDTPGILSENAVRPDDNDENNGIRKSTRTRTQPVIHYHASFVLTTMKSLVTSSEVNHAFKNETVNSYNSTLFASAVDKLKKKNGSKNTTKNKTSSPLSNTLFKKPGRPRKQALKAKQNNKSTNVKRKKVEIQNTVGNTQDTEGDADVGEQTLKAVDDRNEASTSVDNSAEQNNKRTNVKRKKVGIQNTVGNTQDTESDADAGSGVRDNTSLRGMVDSIFSGHIQDSASTSVNSPEKQNSTRTPTKRKRTQPENTESNTQIQDVAVIEHQDVRRSEMLNGDHLIRNYFHFPQNNKICKVDWLTVEPKLKRTYGDIRFGSGPKSSSDGFQSGFLEIQPGKRKHRDMATKFSLFFLVLEGNAFFRIHDSCSSAKRWSAVYVPLGVYYSIENESQSERLFLSFVKFKPQSI